MQKCKNNNIFLQFPDIDTFFKKSIISLLLLPSVIFSLTLSTFLLDFQRSILSSWLSLIRSQHANCIERKGYIIMSLVGWLVCAICAPKCQMSYACQNLIAREASSTLSGWPGPRVTSKRFRFIFADGKELN